MTITTGVGTATVDARGLTKEFNAVKALRWPGPEVPPGTTYAALCSLPAPAIGLPHALLGEVDVFTLG